MIPNEFVKGGALRLAFRRYLADFRKLFFDALDGLYILRRMGDDRRLIYVCFRGQSREEPIF